jgi:hypothetical protein
MRYPLLFMLLLLLAACGATVAPTPTALPQPTAPAVNELLQRPAAGPTSTFGYLYLTAEGAMVVDGLRVDATGALQPVDGDALWLDPPPTLPDDAALTESGEARYAIVAASGALEGPAAFGPGGAYSYQLKGPSVEVLSVRELSIALLLSNSQLYEGQPVHIQGELLANSADALLVERLGVGGVPAEGALQIKLAKPPADPGLLDRLRSAGRVSFGPVDVTGVWRGGSLYPLLVTAR